MVASNMQVCKLNMGPIATKLMAILTAILFFACNNKQVDQSMFTVLNNEKTGLNFTNQLNPTPAFNLFSYMYYYNGAGAGAGDFNNDGLIDLFFSANQASNALYLNKGGMQFQDVSVVAGIPRDSAWSTGVSVVDINNDGLLDIYICRVGHFKVLHGKNQLLICTGIDAKGIPHYQEQAAAYGLDFSGFSTQAAFLDLDGDGDLDMFLLNHSVNHDGNYAPRAYFENTFDTLAGQKMYRNDRNHFIDITKQSGINGSKIGYGLGVAVADINLDGWPDIYVGNDFHENDYLYINQQNGTFKEEGTAQMMHTSQFSMGVDVADVNNDAFPDIISMDMLPYEPYMLRRSLSEDDYNIFQNKIAYGYTYQYARNNLQYNRKNKKFSEVGQYAGVHATDWSWASLWMDFNNDGRKDLFVSNGIPKRMNDIDYINFVSGNEIQQKLKENSIQDKDLALINKFPEIKIPNQFFLNQGNFKFTNLTDSIVHNPPTFSNGSIYADLDNDGDLDIVVNNINDPVLVYENNTNKANQQKSYALLKLLGAPNNTQAVGAKIVLYTKEQVHTYEHTAVHGFQSSMIGPIHIGLDGVKPDSVMLIWPDNGYEQIQLKPNSLNTFNYKKGLPKFDYVRLRNHQKNIAELTFENITANTGLQYKHAENVFNEFDREPLIPHMISTEGPAAAVADINQDGLEDIFIGASKTFHNVVYIQQANGTFSPMPQPALLADSMWENVDAQWVDVNKDTYPDLVIASGGNEFYGEDVHLKPLLYLNDGKGHLSKKEDAFGNIYVTQSKVIVQDINGDGVPDLFLAGRAEPWQYGIAPRSYLLLNDGAGKFTDVTEQYTKDLMRPGMVTDAKWIDLNGDHQNDLLLCYDWGGIDIFIRQGKSFVKKSITTKNGWWQMVLPVDVDGDGDLDIIAGNFGLNSRLKATTTEPVNLYVNDFDDNGRIEQVMTYFVGGVEIPFASKIQLEKSLPYLKKKFLYAEAFAKANLSDLLGQKKLTSAVKLQANCFENMVFINDGKMNFTANPLPFDAQLSTYRAAIAVPSAQKNIPQILWMGNFYSNNVELGRMDADFGTLLQFKGAGNYEAGAMNQLNIEGQVRNILPLQIGKRLTYLIIKNDDPVMVIAPK